MWSFIVRSAILCPPLIVPGKINPAPDIDSVPPAITKSASPALMLEKAVITDFIPLPQIIFIE